MRTTARCCSRLLSAFREPGLLAGILPNIWPRSAGLLAGLYVVSSKIYDKRDDFDFDIVNCPFLDGDVPRRASYGVYISQLIRFARVCNHVTDFNARNKCITAKLLQQGYRYHKLQKTFSKFYRRHYELISKYNVVSKTLFLGFWSGSLFLIAHFPDLCLLVLF